MPTPVARQHISSARGGSEGALLNFRARTRVTRVEMDRGGGLVLIGSP